MLLTKILACLYTFISLPLFNADIIANITSLNNFDIGIAIADDSEDMMRKFDETGKCQVKTMSQVRIPRLSYIKYVV